MKPEPTRKEVLEAQQNKGQEQTEARLAPFFEQPELLKKIWEVLDRDHKLDHKEKLALFIVAASAELPNPNDHCSASIKGDSSSGKDNAIKTVLKHFPQEDNYFLTRGTTAALEEEAENVKRIAFSEINKNRENGANKDVVELVKQLSEGGTDVMKRDTATGFRTTKHVKAKQKSVFFGTTETESDEELDTRNVKISIKGYASKNKIVVEDVLDKAGDYDTQLERGNSYSWIASSIKALDNELIPIIPFAKFLREKIKDGEKEVYFFDYTKERVKRDAKRLLSLTKAIAWLHQKQRCVKEYKGEKFVVAEPCDFIAAVTIFAEFFNLTYSGLDHRIEKTLKTLRELEGKHDGEIAAMNFPSKYYGYVIRHRLQEKCGVASLNTIKKYLDKLKDLGYIEDTYYNAETNPKAFLIKTEGCQMGVNRVVLPVTLTALDTHLTTKITPEIITKFYWGRELSTIDLDFLQNLSIYSEIDTHQIDTHQIEGKRAQEEPQVTRENIGVSK